MFDLVTPSTSRPALETSVFSSLPISSFSSGSAAPISTYVPTSTASSVLSSEPLNSSPISIPGSEIEATPTPSYSTLSYGVATSSDISTSQAISSTAQVSSTPLSPSPTASSSSSSLTRLPSSSPLVIKPSSSFAYSIAGTAGALTSIATSLISSFTSSRNNLLASSSTSLPLLASPSSTSLAIRVADVGSNNNNDLTYVLASAAAAAFITLALIAAGVVFAYKACRRAHLRSGESRTTLISNTSDFSRRTVSNPLYQEDAEAYDYFKRNSDCSVTSETSNPELTKSTLERLKLCQDAGDQSLHTRYLAKQSSKAEQELELALASADSIFDGLTIHNSETDLETKTTQV